MVSSTTPVPKTTVPVVPHITTLAPVYVTKDPSYPPLPASTFAAGTPKELYGYEIFQASEKEFF